MFLDLNGPVTANTVYRNGVLVAREVTLSLPPVNFVTHDYKAMGTMTLPVPGLVEAMEMTVSKVGLDLGFCRLIQLKSDTFEYRWFQHGVKQTGEPKKEICKAFVRGIPKGIPGIGVEPGSPSENEIAIGVSRYQLFVGDQEYFLIDQLAGIQRIFGVDYAEDEANML